MFARHCLSLGSLVTFFLLALASSPSKNIYSDADNWIPESFDPEHTTLLIATHPINEKQNSRMIKFLEDTYPFAFEVVSEEVIKANADKYSDVKKYRFGLLWRESATSSVGMDATGRPSTNRAWDMFGYFIDRSTGKTYSSTQKRNVYGQIGYKPVVNSIVKKFKK